MKFNLTEEESERLENCAQSTGVPQLWKADGKGPAMTITDIVRSGGTGPRGEIPKKWKPVSLSEVVKTWKPKNSVKDSVSCACDGKGCENCSY